MKIIGKIIIIILALTIITSTQIISDSVCNVEAAKPTGEVNVSAPTQETIQNECVDSTEDVSSENMSALDSNPTKDEINKIEPTQPAATEPEIDAPAIDEETEAEDVDSPEKAPAVEVTPECAVPEETAPSVNFTSVDEYLYVNTEILKVQTGPSVEYDTLAVVGLNTVVHRIGVGDNGWSKIDHNGNEAYVNSEYLSYQEIYVETVAEEMIRRGSMGRLTIPSVGVNVALFKISGHTNSQHIVDADDSAAYLYDTADYFGQILIADHVHQGFYGIKSSVPGQTYAYIDFGDHLETYVCTKLFIGRNTKGDLVDLDCVSIKNQNDGGICMYTCNYDDTITITFWQHVN